MTRRDSMSKGLDNSNIRGKGDKKIREQETA
jgi:hypothetical protein